MDDSSLAAQLPELHSLHKEFFCCPEESQFYASCLRDLLLRSPVAEQITEFGAGDGVPMLEALRNSGFTGRVLGYEINPEAAARAQENIHRAGERNRYQVQNRCFHQAHKYASPGICLAANPPYLPAPDPERLILPLLWGGPDGTRLLRALLEQEADYVLQLLPSIANPVRVLEHARGKGYWVQDYIAAPLEFGIYTAQDYVRRHLCKMREQGKAHYFREHYLLAGVLFSRQKPRNAGLDASLLQILTGAGE